MSKMRSIDTRFWSDSWVRKLNALDRYLFLYLLSNDKCSFCGIYELPLSIMAFESGLDENDLEKTMLPRLEPKAYYWKEWVFLTNFYKYHVNDSPNNQKGYESALKEVPQDILDYFKPLEAPPSVLPSSASASSSASAITSNKDISMKSYSEEKHSDQWDQVIDIDTGLPVKKILKDVSPSIASSMWELVAWATKEKRGGRLFPNLGVQFKAMKKLRLMGIPPHEIIKRWEWLETKDFYKESGIDFSSLVKSFEKKPL